MQRTKLKDIIRKAADYAGCRETDTKRLVQTAEVTDRIAVDSFAIRSSGVHCGCPATAAGYYDVDESSWIAGTPPQVKEFARQFDKLFSYAYPENRQHLVQSPPGMQAGTFVQIED